MHSNSVCINLPNAVIDTITIVNGYKNQGQAFKIFSIPNFIRFNDTYTELNMFDFNPKKFMLIPDISEPEKSCATISNFISNEYILTKAINVDIEIHDDEILALIPSLELYGEGITEIQALDDLEYEMIELFKYLTSIPDKNLGKLPKKWKKIITSMIQKKSDN